MAARKPRMEALKEFVRSKGSDYLKDPNITSVGIGYKMKEGKRTDELAIQFTVGTKAMPQALECLDTEMIPESFVIDGVEIPTDVIQRSFKPEFKRIPQILPDLRKVRADPVRPGMSIGHPKITAGTLGCIVYDAVDGTPYILSNWHVLNGKDGTIGDVVVQPGAFDDNRVAQNRVGVLVRSHLGPAGDCAIARIDNRGFDPGIIELGVNVDAAGEAELDDKVVKSGRTTGVTHGIVRRVHVMTSLDYDLPEGDVQIGGFEIGPDPDAPADDGEVSKGGDSGAAWLFKDQQGKTTTIMAGLHFAGEGDGDNDEHAIACYPKSIFEKLQITLPRPEVDEAAEAAVPRTGYNPDFLSAKVDLPQLPAAKKQDAVTLANSEVIKYTHFSLALSKKRRFAYWVAWNVDGGQLKKVSRKSIPFIKDPRLPAKSQIGDELYADNRLDRGHIARRADLLWGSLEEAKQANKDSFYFSNITPQMDDFNQSSKDGIWGRLEDAVFDEADVENLRISAIGGPVFGDDDPLFRGVRIPREFWKIIVYVDGGLKAKGFLLTQNFNPEPEALELFPLTAFKVFQATLSEIEQRVGFTFPNSLKEADEFAEQVERLSRRRDPEALAANRQPLTSLDDIVW